MIELPVVTMVANHPRSALRVRSRRQLLSDAHLRRFLLSQGGGQIADAMTTLTLAQVIVFDLERGATPGALARALITTSLPFLIAGPLAGVVADRWHRRRTLAVTTTTRGLLTLIAIVVPITRSPFVGYIVVGALLAAARVLYTVRAASLPHLADSQDLVATDSLALLVGTAAGVVGAALGAGVQVVSPIVALVIATGIHAAAAVGFLTLRRELGGRQPKSADLHVPVNVVARRVARLIGSQPTRFAIAATSGHRALLGAAFATFVLLADARYHIEASGYAAALGVLAAGGFVGTLTAPRAAERLSRREVATAAYGGAAVSMWVAWLAPESAVVTVAMFCAAFAFQNLRLKTDALVQRSIDDDTLGRVFAAYDIVYNLAFIGGALAVVGTFSGQSPQPFFVIAVAYSVGVASRPARAWKRMLISNRGRK